MAHLRISPRVDDRVDALLYVSIFGDGGVCQTSINSTVKARAPVVYSIVLVAGLIPPARAICTAELGSVACPQQ